MRLNTFLKILPNGTNCIICNNITSVRLTLTRKLTGQTRRKLTEVSNTDDELLVTGSGISLQDRISCVQFDETGDVIITLK